jgi:16S rRNA G966 N2-methylase RsmD
MWVFISYIIYLYIKEKIYLRMISLIIEMDTEYQNLKSDEEGLYSLSHKDDADKLSSIIKDKYGDISILDATSGIGGNSISFGTNFTNVISIELNTERFKLLKENLESRNLKNILINGNFMNFINMNYDLIFIDPPWGGPNYKFEKKIKLSLNNISLKEVTSILKIKDKIVIWKLPYNYELKEFDKFNYQIHNIKNYLILII